MEKILGLDLGTNSIGWAIRDTSEPENQIIDKGVLVFDKGVATVEGREQPKVKERTEARGRRRNYQAEKYRKYILLECLIENKMCPLTISELNEWRHYKKGIGRKYPQSKIFHQWLQFDFNGDGKPDFEQFGFSKHENCYLFRWLAVSNKEEHKKLFKKNPMLLGRVFYQLAQRRGFRKGDDDNETKLIEEGRKNEITKEVEVVGVKVIDNLIKEKYKTLGATLYWGQKNNELENINNNRIRNRFTYRDYFKNEVESIFENLGFDNNSFFCKTVSHCIVEQRPLRSQNGLVGFCTLDAPLKSKTGIYYKPGKKRIPLSHPLYEEYRTWNFINNLKIELPDSVNRIDFINNIVLPIFNRTTDFYFSNKKDKNGKIISKGLKTKIEEAGAKVLAKYDKNLEEDDEGIRYNANVFQNKLETLFGKNWRDVLRWNETLNGFGKTENYLRAEDIWHLFYDAIITKKQTENLGDVLVPILQKHFPEINFDKKDFETKSLGSNGYASLSAASIRKILPFLKQGMLYSQAVFVANLEKVFNKKLNKEQLEKLTDDFNQIVAKHKSDKEVYGVVNNLISDRLYYRDRLNMGEEYMLDDYDRRDIEEKIKDTFKSKVWSKKTEEQKQEFFSNVSKEYQTFLRQSLGIQKSKLFLKIYRIDDKLDKLLIEKYHTDPTRIAKFLWHPSEQEKYPPANIKKDFSGKIITDVDGKEIYFLGDPNPISRGFKNPMAMKTLQILKKHLNYLLRTGKINFNTKIVVEIARLLNDANKRRSIERLQGDNRRKRDKFRKAIEECFGENNIPNRNITETLLDRYELWEEQTKKCLYCSKEISCTDVLNGTAQLEHTIPVKISNCYELYNLTLSHPECNAKKGKRFPTQWKENYELIKKNVGFMYAKYMSHKEIFEKTFDRARTASDKKAKDAAIQDRHYHKEYMNYWRKKYETFTIEVEDITNQFRRQQLTDTQIITKYALPYLKTVFNRVDVQKGTTTARFRKIFQIEPKIAEKDRSEHSHHYVDAAVLTLIPPASIRDNIMKEYNKAVDNNTLNDYVHPKPKNWEGFQQSFITSLKDEIIINHLSEDRTLKQTFKYKRKRGEFIKDKNGNKIIQRGDTTRGKLHDESIFGMIKIPETEFKNGKYRLKIINDNLTFKQNDKRNDDLFVVKKIKITDFTSIEDFEKLVIDPNLGYYLKNEVARRIKEDNLSFEKALINLYAFGKKKDRNGNQLQPIRHLRTKARGRGGLIVNPTLIKHIEKAFESKRVHKRKTYAGNGEVPVCGFYEWQIKGKRQRELIPYSILKLSKLYHFEKMKEVFPNKIYETRGSGKNKVEYEKELIAELRKNSQVIFYKENVNELKELYTSNPSLFAKRIYSIIKFDEDRITFQHHLCSLSNDNINKEMKKRGVPVEGSSKLDYENPFLKLRLSQGALNMAIEGKHFEIKSDGKINWQC